MTSGSADIGSDIVVLSSFCDNENSCLDEMRHGLPNPNIFCGILRDARYRWPSLILGRAAHAQFGGDAAKAGVLRR